MTGVLKCGKHKPPKYHKSKKSGLLYTVINGIKSLTTCRTHGQSLPTTASKTLVWYWKDGVHPMIYPNVHDVSNPGARLTKEFTPLNSLPTIWRVSLCFRISFAPFHLGKKQQPFKASPNLEKISPRWRYVLNTILRIKELLNVLLLEYITFPSNSWGDPSASNVNDTTFVC